MQNSSLIKWFAGLTALIFVVAALLNFWKPDAPARPGAAPAPAMPHETAATYNSPAPRAARPVPEPEPEPEPESNENGLPKLPRDKVEAWLAKHNRNASSLLTAFRAMGDTNYLNEAATNFPNDPHVELAVLARDEFPAERRKWLDLFKSSSPSNSLANYFSAQDYFQNGNADAAVNELIAAADKPQFENHGIDTQLDAEELYLDSGKSAKEAVTFAMSAMAEEDLPQLATFRRVDQGVLDLIQQKLAAGDADSAVNLAQTGMIMADKLNSGDSGKYLINQLVGMASEAVMLSHLDQNTAYDFLDGRTPAQILQENKQQKADFRELHENFQAIYPSLTDAEFNNYIQRVRIYGEAAAAQWVIQQHPSADPAK
jgi:hypothetical protein